MRRLRVGRILMIGLIITITYKLGIIETVRMEGLDINLKDKDRGGLYKGIILLIVGLIIGVGIDKVNKEGRLVRIKWLDLILKRLEGIINKHYIKIIVIIIIIHILMKVGIEPNLCAGEEDKDVIKIDKNIGGLIKDINLFKLSITDSSQITSTVSVVAGLKTGLELSKNLPTARGKLLRVGLTMIAGTTSAYILNKDKVLKNEGIDPVEIPKTIGEIEHEVVINNIDGYIELIMDIFHMNTIIIVGMFILLNAFIALNIRGKEEYILKYLTFIEKGSKKERWLRWYIDKWSKGNMFIFIIVWLSILLLLWTIKYTIIKNIIK